MVSMVTQRIDPLKAEVRAVEEGLVARLQEDGTFRVRSSSRYGLTWTVQVEAVKQGGPWYVRMNCTCESGAARPGDLVSCLHGATVARRLERMGWAKWCGGVWCATDKALEALAGIKEELA